MEMESSSLLVIKMGEHTHPKSMQTSSNWAPPDNFIDTDMMLSW